MYVVPPLPPNQNYQVPLTDLLQLLADDFASNGFKVYAPELFEGDPVGEDALSTVCPPLSTSLFIAQACGNHVLGKF